MSDINNKHLNTVSSKLRKMSMLLTYVHEKIIENQEIKRMIYYNTQNPLSKKGLTYSNQKVDQPDLTKKDVEKLITLLPFNPDMKIEVANSIFLGISKAIFRDVNIIYLDVDVISSSEYFQISNGLRLYEIADRIANMFDGIYITDEDYVEELGNLKFTLDDIVPGRLSKSNNMLYASLRFSIQITPQARIRK